MKTTYELIVVTSNGKIIWLDVFKIREHS